ncbi:hypothetical protein V6667_07855 [Neisseria leonii]|uniref:Lipoprotein n=1 Tax=Neisseria leonii TaxID=2995413 RepID=A0A9X4IAI6_9NEIS|nr:hypothetical protein [Neisseria sp. 51.81]MDD9327430.1 hypothetical protein [Neisseria sp. 51.81]
MTIKIGLLCAGSVLLAACSASMTSMLQPEASYLNRQTVASVPKSQSVTVVGSVFDESGNWMPSYPMPAYKEHKTVHIAPVPKSVPVACEQEYTETVGHLRRNVTKRGSGLLQYDFQAGRTYMVFCNIQAGDRFEIYSAGSA